MASFLADWAHCDRLSSYLARMVSHNRQDSLLFSNLFSSAVNELLETAFRHNVEDGLFVCQLHRSGAVDRVELSIPVNEKTESFYRDAFAALSNPALAETYRAALHAEGPLDPRIGFMELAVDYNARFAIEFESSASVRLIADLKIEDTVT